MKHYYIQKLIIAIRLAIICPVSVCATGTTATTATVTTTTTTTTPFVPMARYSCSDVAECKTVTPFTKSNPGVFNYIYDDTNCGTIEMQYGNTHYTKDDLSGACVRAGDSYGGYVRGSDKDDHYLETPIAMYSKASFDCKTGKLTKTYYTEPNCADESEYKWTHCYCILCFIVIVF